MDYKFASIADGSPYPGIVPESVAVPVGREEGNLIVDDILSASVDDANYEDVLVAWMYMNGYVSDVVEEKQDTPVEDSVIVAFDLSDDTEIKALRDRLISNPDDRVDDLHMTLCYLDNASDIDVDAVKEILSSIGITHAPIPGVFNGFGYFEQDDINKIAVVILFDSSYLTGFHFMLKTAMDYSVSNHGFTAHVTLGYIDRDSINLPDESIEMSRTFESIWLYVGSDHFEFPLTGQTVYKQLPIDDDSKKRLIEIRKAMFDDEVDSLAEKVFTGDITVGQWEEQMRALIRELHASIAAISKGGWDQMTPADWGRLGPIMKEQYRYLHNFAQTILENKDSISLEAIKARAHMYGNASEFSSIIVQAGDTFSKKLPWLPKDGSSECLVNCKCYWELKVIDTVYKGGEGSGFHGHAGRPGLVGGSSVEGYVHQFSDAEYKDTSAKYRSDYSKEQIETIDSYRLYPTINSVLRSPFSPDMNTHEIAVQSMSYDEKRQVPRVSTLRTISSREFAETMDDAASLHSVEDVVLYRVGKISSDSFVDKGFVSTSAVEDVFFKDLYPILKTWGEQQEVMRIHVIGKVSAIFTDPNSLEREVILERGLRFRVIGRNIESSNDREYTVVDLEVWK